MRCTWSWTAIARAVASVVFRSCLPAFALCVASGLAAAPVFAAKTENVVLIVSDGLRWQEIFTGADPRLISDKSGGSWVSEADLRKRYWRENPDERRELLFPFLWGTVAKQGQIFGNRLKGGDAHVTNGKAFSYPGYNEMSTGYPNDAIDSNEYCPNPNATVFEWLNKFDELRGRVAIYGTWNVYDNIFNKSRSALVMQTGWTLPPVSGQETPRDALLRELYSTTTQFDEEDVGNSFLQVSLIDYVRTGQPRVLFVDTAKPTIGRIRGATIWCSTVPTGLITSSNNCGKPCSPCLAIEGPTTFIITTDHGRAAAWQWKERRRAEGLREHLDCRLRAGHCRARRARARRAGHPGANRGHGGGIRRQGLSRRGAASGTADRRCLGRHPRKQIAPGRADHVRFDFLYYTRDITKIAMLKVYQCAR